MQVFVHIILFLYINSIRQSRTSTEKRDAKQMIYSYLGYEHIEWVRGTQACACGYIILIYSTKHVESQLKFKLQKLQRLR